MAFGTKCSCENDICNIFSVLEMLEAGLKKTVICFNLYPAINSFLAIEKQLKKYCIWLNR